MIQIDIKGIPGVQNALKNYPGKAHRACAVALNQTGKEIKTVMQAEMRRVFDRPTRYTLNSLYLSPAKKDKLVARVWFKDPERMGQHYLVPQVEGGPRKLKGFERGLENEQFVPAKKTKRNSSGNIGYMEIKKMLSELGKTEAMENKKPREYVLITRRRGKLIPGVYERHRMGAQGFSAKIKATFADKSRVYQRGRTRNGISSVIRGRGLRPFLLLGKTGHAVKPLYDFYGVANKTFQREFVPRFYATLNRFMGS